jgi:hypothetical protein
VYFVPRLDKRVGLLDEPGISGGLAWC